jgi:thiazole synthase ThiGH ThiG subunit
MIISMIVRRFDVIGIAVSPAQAQAPLLIDPDRVLAGAVALQPFQAIAWRHAQVIKSMSGMQQQELPETRGCQCARDAFGDAFAEIGSHFISACFSWEDD